MGRKTVTRALPDLPKRFAVEIHEHKTHRLLELLRSVALTTQEDRPHPFYSVRQVSQRFRISISTVSQIYGQLEREGILSRLRGSKTILRGGKYDRKISVRAFIALPSSISRFVTQQDYRMFFIRARRELRLRGFATTMVFLEKHNGQDLKERLKKYQVDTVIWFSPELSARHAFASLKDSGVRVIGISDGGIPAIPCHYEVQREAAIRAILHHWHRFCGLESVTVVSDATRRFAADEERLGRILEGQPLRYHFMDISDRPIPKSLESLSRKKSSGIVFLSSPASLFAFRAPELFTELLKARRVALIEGPVNLPFAPVPDARVDLVLVDWQLVAERIANDLITQETFDSAKTVVFEAESKFQVPLNQYAQSI